MALGDGITWDESTPVDATIANLIDDYNRDLRKGVRNRIALEHEWPSSQSATSEGGRHKYISFQTQASVPTIAGTQVASLYATSGNTLMYSVGTTAGTAVQLASTGRVVQVVNYQTGAVATGTTVIELDDTIPQITEGDEFMTLAITPTSATNKLKIDIVANCSLSLLQYVSIALFQDTTANAIAAVTQIIPGNQYAGVVNFSHFMTAGTTSATTFRVRIGKAGGAGTFTFNGGNGGRYFGGVMPSSITITEVAA